jgi:hypothetical protein
MQGCNIDNNEGLYLIPAAVKAANNADYAIVAIGDTLSTCDEGVDRDRCVACILQSCTIAHL